MKLPLFSQVILKEDIPELNLKKGATATIVEHYPMSTTEDGYSLEGLIEQDTVELTESQIEPYFVKEPAIHQESTIS